MRGFAAIALVALTLVAAGCSSRRDDGMGDLYKGLRHVLEERR